MANEADQLPYWQVNVPESERPAECPDFLRTINDKAKRILSTPDTEYRRLSWAEVEEVVRQNNLDHFQRVPSDLRRYLQYTFKIKNDYGSVMEFVLKERIRWQGLQPKGAPFSEDDDVKVLFNDWPYGIDRDIVHLVVWTKFALEEDLLTGDLTDTARQQIDSYVTATFRHKMDPDHVTWFKNWRSLKSVEAVEHFHVLLYKPDASFIAELTDHDVPLVEKIKQQEIASHALR